MELVFYSCSPSECAEARHARREWNNARIRNTVGLMTEDRSPFKMQMDLWWIIIQAGRKWVKNNNSNNAKPVPLICTVTFHTQQGMYLSSAYAWLCIREQRDTLVLTGRSRRPDDSKGNMSLSLLRKAIFIYVNICMRVSLTHQHPCVWLQPVHTCRRASHSDSVEIMRHNDQAVGW